MIRLLSKYNTLSNTITVKVFLRGINNIADQSNNFQALRGYLQKLDNLKKITENPQRNLEGFTSLTLKSEFSQDVSDFFFR